MHTHTHMHTHAHARVCMHAPQADNHRAKTFGLVFVLKVIQESKDFIRSIDGDSREYSFVKIRFVASLLLTHISYTRFSQENHCNNALYSCAIMRT